jgi:putative ABC transport system permease protein
MARIRYSLRSWLWRVDVHQEVDEEIAFHIEMRTRELIERGVDPTSAREIVLARLGDVTRLKRTCIDLGRRRDREMRLTQWFGEFTTDVRFAIRQLRAAPGFALVAALTLALGIGANSAMFALADATLLRPLPYAEAGRLVMVWERTARVPRAGVSPASLLDWEAQSQSFEVLAAITFGAGGGPLVEGPDGSLQSADRQTVSARFFDVLGVTPIAGRTFRPADAERSACATPPCQAAPVVVISEGLWRTRFGSDQALIGRDIRLNGDPFTVIGIVRDDVQLQRPASVWSLMPEAPPNLPRAARFLQVIGRLKPGMTVDAAQADLAVVADRIARAHPETNKDWSVLVEPLRSGVMGRDLRMTALFLFGVVGFVLLLCCANVANLLLARSNVRARELAVRSALGAGRPRIVAQLLTESLVLATFGGLLGAGVGIAILKVAPTLIPPGLLPAAVSIAFDGRVVAFCAVAAIGVGVLFGLVPAWQATRPALIQAISSESRSATSRGGRFRHIVVAGQVAAAVLLLCGAGLLVRTLLVLGSFDTGYRADSDAVLTLDFSLPAPAEGTRYPTFESLTQFYDEASREVQAIPGVRSIGWSTGLPYGTTEMGRLPFEIVGAPQVDVSNRPAANFQAASPGYFRTLDLPIVAGREFDERDTQQTGRVCIVNEAFARRHLAGRNPIGTRIVTGLNVPGLFKPAAWEVVGVARQMRERADEPEEPALVYVPLAQFPFTDTYLVVQATTGPVQALLTPIRQAIARIDRNVPVRRERTLTDLANLTTAPHRFRAVMVGTFAALALALAMVGIFGVLTYSVEQRAREFGVRVALGATSASILRLVLGSAALTIAIGAAIGLAAAAAVSQAISVFLFGVQPLDPVTFVSVGLLLTLTAILATAAPAWRATRVDPVEAFRSE